MSPILLVIAMFAVAESPAPLEGDAATLQGVWEIHKQHDGQPYVVSKEIAGYRETLRVTRGGKLEHEHVVEFELEQTGGIHIFRWKNGQVTAGRRQGQKVPDGAYVYRLKEDQWTGVFGVTDQEQGPIYTEVFRRRQ